MGQGTYPICAYVPYQLDSVQEPGWSLTPQELPQN